MKWFIRFAIVSLIGCYLLIFIGSLVRISGAGLGCPDWPKCHGKLTPPTSQEELEKGLIEKYVQDNPGVEIPLVINPERQHFILSWIEYINRLSGALLGIIVIITMILAIKKCRKYQDLVWLSVICLMLTVTNGLIGKFVVTSELNPWLISTHMLLALLLVSVEVYMILLAYVRSKEMEFNSNRFEPTVRKLLIALWIISIVQICFGAGFRGQLEQVHKTQPFLSDFELFEELVWVKYTHIALGILTTLMAFFLAVKLCQSKYSKNVKRTVLLMVILLIIEIIMGFSFKHIGLIGILRIFHLWIGSVHIAILLYLYIAARPLSEDEEDSPKLWLQSVIGTCIILIIMSAVAWITIHYADKAREVPYLATKAGGGLDGWDAKVPEFELTDRDGKSFSLEDMKGKITVLNFMFTTCRNICPMTITSMSQDLYKYFESEDLVQFVSITVDPETDTLERLDQYANNFGITKENKKWVFLRGDIEKVVELSEKGFHLALVKNEKTGIYEGHSDRFVLIDTEGNIRSTHPFGRELNHFSSGKVIHDNSNVELLKNYITQLILEQKNK